MRRLTTWTLTACVALAFSAAPALAQGKNKGKGKGDQGLEYEPEDAKRSPPSNILERAIKLYDKKDYYPAALELKKVLAGETSDDARNKQRAEFFMGKTLYKLQFYAASLAYFDKIVQAGANHAYHGATLKWLAALSQVLPESSGILEKVGTYDQAALEDPLMSEVKDQLYYLLGRHFYRKGGEADFETAVSLFQRVGRDSEWFIKAKFFEGVTYVRKLDGKAAGEAFKEILVIGRERPKQYKAADIRDYEELAILQMARVFYSVGSFDKAIRYYEKLEQASPDWAPSLFEASWAYFMLTKNSKALGNIHTLNAPYFEDSFFPESVLLKSVIYYNYCLYDQALESVTEYDNKFRPLRKNLQEAVAKYEDNAEFYEYIRKVQEGKAGLDEQTQRLMLSVLNDQTLDKTFAWVDELGRELKVLEKSDKAWQKTEIASEVLQELTLQKSLAEADAGKLARERVNRLIEELRVLSNDGIKIKIEVLGAKAGQIETKYAGGKISSDHQEEPIEIDDEHFMWKFNGEYWKDELGYYRFRIRSRCPKK